MSTANPQPKTGEPLAQGEVERLLEQVQAEEASAVADQAERPATPTQREQVQRYDFRQSAFFSGAELRRLKLRHEEFVRSFAAHLSVYLRLEVTIQLAGLQTLSYQKYQESLPSPTHLTLFKIEPLNGVCLLDMAPRLGLTIVDRLLGGPAHSVNASGDLSEIETALLDQVALMLLTEWCGLWPKAEGARPVILGHENNGRFLDCSAQDSAMFMVSMEVRLGDCAESMQMAFPFLAVEPLLRQPGLKEPAGLKTPPPKPGPAQWNLILNDVPLQLHAEWSGLELSARDLASLKCGEVLMLKEGCFDQVEIRLERQPLFCGRLGASEEHRAVELTQTLKT